MKRNFYKTAMGILSDAINLGPRRKESLHYVITQGTDCDGGYTQSITAFDDRDKAFDVAHRRNEHSDGPVSAVLDYGEAVGWCESNEEDMPDFYFDKNLNPVDVN